jgi:hypothetical protein
MITNISEGNPFFITLLICAALMLLYGLLLALNKEKRDDSRIYLFSALISLLFYVFYKAADYGLPLVINPYRFGIFLALFAALTYAGTLNITDFIVKHRSVNRSLKAAAAIGVMAVILMFVPVKLPLGDRFEYDEAARAYLKIKDSFPALSWTIVAPVEQYQQCMGYGWHVELLEFARKMSAAQGPRGDKSYSIPTNYIFIFTEKIPLGSSRTMEITDSEAKIPEPVGDETEFYYRKPENRAILEAKVYYWAEDYMKRKNNMEVFYDGQYMKIYLIRQDYKNPVRLFA